jgi:hypothetical protein
MGKPGSVIIAFVVYKNLGFVFQSPEGSGMYNSVAVSLVCGAVRVLFFLIDTAAAIIAFHGIGR